MRSSNCADSSARYCSSGSGSTPLRFSARHARRIVSRAYRVDSSSAVRPFCPGLAPGSISDRSRWSSAACGRFSTMYGHISSISGPIARPLSCQIHAGLALGDFGRVGPATAPPANSRHRHTRTSVVDAMEIVACHVVDPPGELRPIMYEPSPSSSPARYAASTSLMEQEYQGVGTKPSYWRTAVNNLRALDDEMGAPSLFDREEQGA